MGLPRSILVLDDEPNFCRILEAKLTKASFDARVASDAAAAFRLLLAKSFDLILLDLRLPDANGLDLIPRLRLVAPATIILVMTAYEEEGLRGRALRAGAVDVLYKPFDLNVLTSTVGRLIESGAPRERPASLISDTLAVGRAVVLQRVPEKGTPPQPATVMEERTETFAVATQDQMPVQAGEPVLVSITGADALYEFHSKVVSTSPPATLSLIKPAVIHRNQRRRHPRRVFQRPVEIRPAHTGDVVNGITLDLSAGGLCAAVSAPIESGAAVSVSFNASEQTPGPFRADAKVVRSEPVVSRESSQVHRVGLEFTDVPAPYRPLLRTLTDISSEI